MTLEELQALLAGKQERRTYKAAEVRLAAGKGDAAPKITGYAAVFNSPSEVLDDGWGFSFVERIMPGAFSKTITEADVRALMNHDPNYVLGRNVSGTLTLAEDGHGLATDIAPPDTQWARDLQETMKRGDVNQMSFAFQVIRERWLEDRSDNARYPLIRDVLEVKLFDVSVVTFPAYPQTSAVVRGLLMGADVNVEELSSALALVGAGAPLPPESRARLQGAIDALQAHLPSTPEIHLLGMDKRRRELEMYRTLVAVK